MCVYIHIYVHTYYLITKATPKVAAFYHHYTVNKCKLREAKLCKWKKWETNLYVYDFKVPY